MNKYLITILLLISNVSFANTFYVDTATGNNSNLGTSETTALKTIQTAITKSAPNDIISIKSGVYKESIKISKDKITLQAFNPLNKPILDGNAGAYLPLGNWNAMVTITGNYNNIKNIEIRNSNITGIYSGGYGVEVTGHHNILSALKVHHIWEQGIVLEGDYNTIEDSEIYKSAFHNSSGTPTGSWANGISATRNTSSAALTPGITSYTTIRRNTVYNNYGEGIDCFEAAYCTIEDNTIYDNWTIDLYVSDATNSIIKNNLVYNSSAPAITYRNNSKPSLLLLADEVASKPRSKNNTIINNMFYNGTISLFGWTGVTGSGLNNVLLANNTIVDGRLSIGTSNNINSRIINNIILGNASLVSNIPNNTGITFSNNNWLTNPPTPAVSSSNVIGNPSLGLNSTTLPGTMSKLYFQLTTNSIVINKGLTLPEVTIDSFNNLRNDGTLDIGGHEYKGTLAPTPVPVPTPTPIPCGV